MKKRLPTRYLLKQLSRGTWFCDDTKMFAPDSGRTPSLQIQGTLGRGTAKRLSDSPRRAGAMKVQLYCQVMLHWFCRIKQVPSYCQVMLKYFCRIKQVSTWREVPSYEVEIKRWEQCASQVRQLTGLEEIFLSTCQNVIDIDIVSFLLSIGQKRREGVCKQNICTTITAGVIMEEALLSELSSLSWYICMYTLTRAPALLH